MLFFCKSLHAFNKQQPLVHTFLLCKSYVNWRNGGSCSKSLFSAGTFVFYLETGVAAIAKQSFTNKGFVVKNSW